MNERYDVYFTGRVLEGHDPEQVRRQLGSLFNADQRTLDLLFSGKPRLIKRGCDRASAEKYKNAMERVGAVPVITRGDAAPGSTREAARPATAAEKIAALAAQPDDLRYRSGTDPDPAGEQASADAPATTGIGLAPPGTAVLREEERAVPRVREIDTTGLEVDTTATRLSVASEPLPATLDTSHLSLAATGEVIPNLPSSATPLSPDTDGLALSKTGTDFSDCAAPEAPPPILDLSRLSLEPAGADILEEQYRKRESRKGPSTDHLTLED